MIFDALGNKIFPVWPGGGIQNDVIMKNYIFLPGNFNSSFNFNLFATSSRKIKDHALESQLTLLVWACLSLSLFIFTRTRQFRLSLSVFIVFRNFRLIFYFVLVTIIIFTWSISGWLWLV